MGIMAQLDFWGLEVGVHGEMATWYIFGDSSVSESPDSSLEEDISHDEQTHKGKGGV